jgi:hypothetical protein
MSGCPDFEYIRTKISVIAVARELGLSVSGNRAHCWRAESHRHGDANPSLSFSKKLNKARCFVCDPHAHSTIDLVMLHRQCDRRAAVFWITEKFRVPALPPGSHIKKRTAWFPRFHSGVDENVLSWLVRSLIWSELTRAEQSIVAVLVTYTDRERGTTEISYRGLLRYSGIGSEATIAAAIRRFEQMRLLRVIRNQDGPCSRRVNQYCFTLDDPEFQALVAKVYERERDEIELEKQLRAEAKKARASSGVPVKVILSSPVEVRGDSPLQPE